MKKFSIAETIKDKSCVISSVDTGISYRIFSQLKVRNQNKNHSTRKVIISDEDFLHKHFIHESTSFPVDVELCDSICIFCNGN